VVSILTRILTVITHHHRRRRRRRLHQQRHLFFIVHASHSNARECVASLAGYHLYCVPALRRWCIVIGDVYVCVNQRQRWNSWTWSRPRRRRRQTSRCVLTISYFTPPSKLASSNVDDKHRALWCRVTPRDASLCRVYSSTTTTPTRTHWINVTIAVTVSRSLHHHHHHPHAGNQQPPAGELVPSSLLLRDLFAVSPMHHPRCSPFIPCSHVGFVMPFCAYIIVTSKVSAKRVLMQLSIFRTGLILDSKFLK